MGGQARVKVRNDIAELARLSGFVAEVCARGSVPPDAAADCELALEEIFANVVRYGYPQGGEHEIDVSVGVDGGVVTLAVEDDGVAFNPVDTPLVNLDLPLEQRGVGGLGIHMVKGIMDELEYERIGNRNRMVMRKRVGP